MLLKYLRVLQGFLNHSIYSYRVRIGTNIMSHEYSITYDIYYCLYCTTCHILVHQYQYRSYSPYDNYRRQQESTGLARNFKPDAQSTQRITSFFGFAPRCLTAIYHGPDRWSHGRYHLSLTMIHVYLNLKNALFLSRSVVRVALSNAILAQNLCCSYCQCAELEKV